MNYFAHLTADIYLNTQPIQDVYSEDFGPYETLPDLVEDLEDKIDFSDCNYGVSGQTIIVDRGGLQMRLMFTDGADELPPRAADWIRMMLVNPKPSWQSKLESAANYLRRLTGK